MRSLVNKTSDDLILPKVGRVNAFDRLDVEDEVAERYRGHPHFDIDPPLDPLPESAPDASNESSE